MFNLSLLSYCHFRMADYFVIQFVALLQAVNDFAFLVVAHAGNHCYSLVNVQFS